MQDGVESYITRTVYPRSTTSLSINTAKADVLQCACPSAHVHILGLTPITAHVLPRRCVLWLCAHL